jgi:UDP-N-acetylglucosamine diphosphorylase/glucosamine-1-phosphate N-acetyltransferase
MNIILFDDHFRENLLPFTYLRPVSEIRVGIFRISEKWKNWTGVQVSYHTEDYLSRKYPRMVSKENLMINGRVLPDVDLLGRIRSLSMDEKLMSGDTLVACWVDKSEAETFIPSEITGKTVVQLDQEPDCICRPWDIFLKNGSEIRKDYDWICIKNRSSGISDAHTIVYNPEHIFVEKGARIRASVLNADEGPIYIGRNAVVGEGTLIRGPFALGDHAQLNMGAKIRGDVTIGPYCKVGGEVSNSVFFGYSNKGHDGFMGNSVIGELCNLGADTNTSNLKNNYSGVKVWSFAEEQFVDSGQTFCGLMMGDHTKCGINTMFNTGTVTGISCNIFDGGFPPKMIPSFSWGGKDGFETFKFKKAMESAERMMKRRDQHLSETDQVILSGVFKDTKKFRNWEK